MDGCVKSVLFNRETRDFPRHRHNTCQLIYIRKGETRLRTHSGEYRAAAPCLVFLNSLEPHSFEVLSREYERYTVNVSPKEATYGIKGQTLLSVFSNPPSAAPVLDAGPFSEKADVLISLLYGEFIRDDPDSGESGDMLLRLLLIEVRRHYPQAFSDMRSGITQAVSRVRLLLEQQPGRDFSLEELAGQQHVSSYYLAHSFKKITGYGIKQYQQLCRLSLARELLVSTDLPVTEICQRAGFSDLSNFSRHFRRYMSMTPSDYRRQGRAVEESRE